MKNFQIKLEGNSNKEESGNSPTKSSPNSPVKRVTPLTLETAVELKYDLQETIIPYPQVNSQKPIYSRETVFMKIVLLLRNLNKD